MTIQTREEAVRRALAKTTNVVGTCQLVTRSYYDAPSAGDRDNDKDYDAMDGWLSEPAATRHTGDRNPPAGVPVAFSGGSNGYGHRAISLGGGRVRSTDFDEKTGRYSKGLMGNGTIEQIEKAMGVRYVGWSETITGFMIPQEVKPASKKSRGPHVDKALAELRKARKSSTADKLHLEKAKKHLLAIELK